MSRLCLFGAFVIASLFLIIYPDKITETMYVSYLAAFVAGYGAGKFADKSDKPNKK